MKYKIDLEDDEKEYLEKLWDRKFSSKNKIANMQTDMRDTCWNCGGKLVWQADYDFEDMGIEWKDDDGNELVGIVQVLHCSNCEAEVEYKVPCGKKDIEELKCLQKKQED